MSKTPSKEHQKAEWAMSEPLLTRWEEANEGLDDAIQEEKLSRQRLYASTKKSKRRRNHILLAVTFALGLLILATSRRILPTALERHLHQTAHSPTQDEQSRTNPRKMFADLNDTVQIGDNVEVALYGAALFYQNETWFQASESNDTSSFVRILGLLQPIMMHTEEFDESWAHRIQVICSYPQLANTKAMTATLWKEYDTTKIKNGDSEIHLVSLPFNIECPVPNQLLYSIPVLDELEISLRFRGAEVHAPALSASEAGVSTKAVNIRLAHRNIEGVELAGCMSPIFGQVPISRLLEWRNHMARLGLKRLAWYSRSAEDASFVETYNKLTGSHDIFKHAPPRSEALSNLPRMGTRRAWRYYYDQAILYNHCLLNLGSSANWLTVMDLDEMPILSPNVNYEAWSNSAALGSFLDFLNSRKPDVGVVRLKRITAGTNEEARTAHNAETDAEIVPLPDPTTLVQDSHRWLEPDYCQADCTILNFTYKAVYRPEKVRTIGIHRPYAMYSAPNSTTDPEDTYKIEYHWDYDDKTGVWPKLFHYRDFGGKAVRHRDDFYTPSVNHARFLDELREQVKEQLPHFDRQFAGS